PRALLEVSRTRTLRLGPPEESVVRIEALGARGGGRFDDGPPRPEDGGEALAQALAARAVTFLAPPPAGWAQGLKGRVVVVFPRLSALADRITIEPAMLDEAAYVRRAMQEYGISPDVAVVGVEPTEADIAAARDKAEAADAVILYLYDAHLFGSNRALLEGLQALKGRLAVILMRDPYDAEFIRAGVTVVTAYG